MQDCKIIHYVCTQVDINISRTMANMTKPIQLLHDRRVLSDIHPDIHYNTLWMRNGITKITLATFLKIIRNELSLIHLHTRSVPAHIVKKVSILSNINIVIIIIIQYNTIQYYL